MNIRRLGSMSLGHMALDIMANSVAIILTAVAGQFELSVSQIGLGALVIMITSSLTQPLFGALADKLRGRWMGPVGLLWYMLFFALVPLAPSYPILLAILMMAGLGSAAVHTAGMVIAPDAGGEKPTTATSIFFLFGQTGLALGPVISGFVIQYMGLAGLPLIPLILSPVVIAMFAFLRDPVAYDSESEAAEAESQGNADHKTSATSSSAAASVGWAVIGMFLMLILLRSTTTHTYMTFLPKYLEGLGYQPAAYGAMTGIFVFGGAIGTLIGGYLGDHFNRRMVIFVSLILSVPFCYVLLGANGWLFAVSAALAGALLNMSHSIIIVIGQALLPKQKGMMSGVTLGFMFASGAFTAWLAGIVADYVGLSAVMYVLAAAPIAGALAVLLLPSTREPESVEPVAAPAGD